MSLVWGAPPNTARWYGEVIIGRDNPSETDYEYGYSDSVDAPTVYELVPDGWYLLQYKVYAINNYRMVVDDS